MATNPDQLDADGDGFGDACDPDPLVRAGSKRALTKPGVATLLAIVFVLPEALALSPVERREPSKRELFEALAWTAWCTEQAHGFSAFTKWDFEASGDYRWAHIAEYPDSGGVGRWTIDRSTTGWVVALDDGERKHVALEPDGSLILDALSLLPCGELKYPELDSLFRPIGSYLRESPPPIRLPDRVVATIEALTRHGWSSAEARDLDHQPTSVRFSKDWSYSSVYRNGECRSSGTWYATSKEIRGYSPGNRCNLQATPGEHLSGSLTSDDELLLNSERYLSEGVPPPLASH